MRGDQSRFRTDYSYRLQRRRDGDGMRVAFAALKFNECASRYLGTNTGSIRSLPRYIIRNLHLAKLPVHYPQLLESGRGVRDDSYKSQDLKQNLPRWCSIGLACMSFFAIAWGWWSLRNQRREGWGYCSLAAGCSLLWISADRIINWWLSTRV